MKQFVVFLGKLFSIFNFYQVFVLVKKISILFYTGLVSNRFKHFGKNSLVSPFQKLSGSKYISIGDNVVIHDNVVLTAWDKYLDDKFSPLIEIGDRTSIGGQCHISAINKISIGNDVLFGRNITIVDNSHGSSKFNLNLSPSMRKLVSRGEIIIGDKVWIGDKCTILAGVKIGNNTIIGANTVVTKDIEENSIIVGSPARKIN